MNFKRKGTDHVISQDDFDSLPFHKQNLFEVTEDEPTHSFDSDDEDSMDDDGNPILSLLGAAAGALVEGMLSGSSDSDAGAGASESPTFEGFGGGSGGGGGAGSDF
jgi:hypothetical protein